MNAVNQLKKVQTLTEFSKLIQKLHKTKKLQNQVLDYCNNLFLEFLCNYDNIEIYETRYIPKISKILSIYRQNIDSDDETVIS